MAASRDLLPAHFPPLYAVMTPFLPAATEKVLHVYNSLLLIRERMQWQNQSLERTVCGLGSQRYSPPKAISLLEAFKEEAQKNHGVALNEIQK